MSSGMGFPTFRSKAFTPKHVRDEPKIYTGCAVCGGKKKLEGPLSKDDGELKGDILIKYLWTQGTDSIHYMRVVNNYVATYQSQKPKKFLETADKYKKKKYLNACLKQNWHFTPIVASVDGLLGVKADETIKCITSRLAKKLKEP